MCAHRSMGQFGHEPRRICRHTSCTSQQTAEVRLDQDSALLQSTTTLCVEETTYDGIHLEAAVSLVLGSLCRCLGAQQVAPVSMPNLSLPWTVLAWTTRCRRCYWEKVRGPKMDSISGLHLAPKDKHVAHVTPSWVTQERAIGVWYSTRFVLAFPGFAARPARAP